MKCHYKVLGVDLEADEEQIKKAYRKKALKWHPDKNLDNAIEAAEQFRLIQAAYDVLIDPQERAWYDRHRDEILHKSEFSSFRDGTLDLLEFFTPSVYKGFGTDAKSFYSVYGDVFRKIVEEDKRFCSEESDEDWDLPEFGDGDSSYDKVVHPFYATWEVYCTKLTYVWIEKYDVHDAPERRVARLMEKENKKERDKEKRKRNEIVRDLVRFVRKRDPRVKVRKEQLEAKAAEQQEKAKLKRAELIKARAEEAALYEQENLYQRHEHEERMSQLEDLLKDEFGFSSEDEGTSNAGSDESASEELFCPACSKQFKTVKAFKNHEQSKKHKEKMQQLRAEMDEELMRENPGVHPPSDEEITKTPKRTKLNKRQKKMQRQQRKMFDNESPEEEAVNEKPQTVQSEALQQNDEPLETDCQLEDTAKNNKLSQNKSKHKKSKKKPVLQEDPRDSSSYCATCKSQFTSRNKLFQHLKSSGHSQLLDNKKSKSKKR